MRPTRKFRPFAPATLEARVVLSHVSLGPSAKPAALTTTDGVEPTKATVDGPLIGNAGNFGGLSIAQTLAAGNPVYEQLTTNYKQEVVSGSNLSTQTEYRLITPDKTARTITTTSRISLRGGGDEEVTEVSSLNASGQVTGRTITTVLPNGAIQTATEVDSVQGGKTYEKGTITLPGGSQETYTGLVTGGGNTTTTNVATTGVDGRVMRVITVVTSKGELRSSAKITTTYPDGTTTVSTSDTDALRMNVPNTGTA